MNLSCKLTLTDEQRNNIKQHLSGKPVKALATRKDVCGLLKDLLSDYLLPPSESRQDDLLDRVVETQAAQEQWADEGESTVVGDGPELLREMQEVMRRNELLQTRVNRLQQLIDTRGLKS